MFLDFRFDFKIHTVLLVNCKYIWYLNTRASTVFKWLKVIWLTNDWDLDYHPNSGIHSSQVIGLWSGSLAMRHKPNHC